MALDQYGQRIPDPNRRSNPRVFSSYGRGGGYGGDDPVSRFASAVPQAGQIGKMVASEGANAPAGTYGALQTPVVGGIQRLLQPRISPARYARGRKRITKGFGAQTGRLAQGGARRGYFSRGGVATGASGRPSAALASGLGEYEVGIEREEARQLEAGLGAAANFREDIGRYGQGVGAFAGEFARQRDRYGRRNFRSANRAPSWAPGQYA